MSLHLLARRMPFLAGADDAERFEQFCAGFFAQMGQIPVAAAAGMMIPEHGTFALFGAGTLPEFGRESLAIPRRAGPSPEPRVKL